MATNITVKGNRVLIHHPMELPKWKQLKWTFSTWDSTTYSVKDTFYTFINNSTLAIPRWFTVKEWNQLFYGIPYVREEDDYLIHMAGIDFKWNKDKKMRDGLQQKALHFLSQNRNATLNTQPGSGKTVIVLKHIADTRVKTLLVMERKMIKQWRKEGLGKSLILEEKEMLTLTSANIKKIVSGDKNVDDVKVFIVTHKILANAIDTPGDYFDILMSKLKVGMKVVDEAHKSFKATWKIDARVDIKYNVYLTATVDRTHYKERDILTRMLPLARFTEDVAERSFHITYMFDQYDTEPDVDTIDKVHNGTHGINVHKWAEWTLDYGWDALYDKLISTLRLAMKKTDGKIILLFNRKAIIRKFLEYIEMEDDFKDEKIAKVFGEYRDEYDVGRIIVATIQIFSDGLDVPDLQVLINTVPFSSAVASVQVSGRLRKIEGKETIYVDILDKGFDKMKRQRAARKRRFKEYAKKMIMIK